MFCVSASSMDMCRRRQMLNALFELAAISCAGDILKAFGTPVSEAFQESIIHAAKAHAQELYGEMDGQNSIAQRIVHDLMTRISAGAQPPFAVLLDHRGLFFHVEARFNILKARDAGTM